jgi:hypothetical protein
MSKGKFNLFSRSAFQALAAGIGAPTGAAAAASSDDEDDDGQAGPAPSDEPQDPPAGDPSDTQPTVDTPADAADPAASADAVVALADAQAVAAERYDAGRKAERARFSAVMSSPAGQANYAMAAWMLENSPEASAEAIVAKLGTIPAGTAAAGAQPIPDTDVDLGKPGAAAALSEGASADDVWASVQGTAAADAPVVSSDAGRMTAAALAAGARTVNAQVPAAPAVSTPAIRPTGN